MNISKEAVLLADKYNIKVNKSKFNSLYGTGTIEGEKVILLKPQTYMNLSGVAVRDFINFYKILRLVFFYPQNFGRGKTRKSDICRKRR